MIRFIIILLLIVIIVAAMRSYKIETYTNLSNIKMYPQTPSDLTCYNYIKNIKEWNVGELTLDQKKLVFTMRVLQGKQYTMDNTAYPYKDACVIPKEHFPIYNRDRNDMSDLTITSPTNNKTYILKYSKETETPEGLVIDFTEIDFENFKAILDGLYELFDSEFIQERKSLKAQLQKLKETKENYQQILRDLQNKTAETERLYNELVNDQEKCPKEKIEKELEPRFQQLNNDYNDIMRKLQIAQDSINNGENQINKLARC